MYSESMHQLRSTPSPSPGRNQTLNHPGKQTRFLSCPSVPMHGSCSPHRALRCRSMLSWPSSWLQPKGSIIEKQIFGRKVQMGPLTVSPMVMNGTMPNTTQGIRKYAYIISAGAWNLVMGKPISLGLWRENGCRFAGAFQPLCGQWHQSFWYGWLLWHRKAKWKVSLAIPRHPLPRHPSLLCHHMCDTMCDSRFVLCLVDRSEILLGRFIKDYPGSDKVRSNLNVATKVMMTEVIII